MRETLSEHVLAIAQNSKFLKLKVQIVHHLYLIIIKCFHQLIKTDGTHLSHTELDQILNVMTNLFKKKKKFSQLLYSNSILQHTQNTTVDRHLDGRTFSGLKL